MTSLVGMEEDRDVPPPRTPITHSSHRVLFERSCSLLPKCLGIAEDSRGNLVPANAHAPHPITSSLQMALRWQAFLKHSAAPSSSAAFVGSVFMKTTCGTDVCQSIDTHARKEDVQVREGSTGGGGRGGLGKGKGHSFQCCMCSFAQKNRFVGSCVRQDGAKQSDGVVLDHVNFVTNTHTHTRIQCDIFVTDSTGLERWRHRG